MQVKDDVAVLRRKIKFGEINDFIQNYHNQFYGLYIYPKNVWFRIL